MASELKSLCLDQALEQPPARKRGRPRQYSGPAEARAEAERRARRKARSLGIVQRSVWLPMDAWKSLRALRRDPKALANLDVDLSPREYL